MLTDLLDTLKAELGNTYTFEHELHGGGMSRVFVANDRALGRKVAVKVLPPEVAAELKVERFRLEIQLAAKLQHPHIVPLLFAGETGGVLYFTMPFIEGESLRAKVARDGPLPIRDAIRTLRQVASALAYAHRQGVVHRDIKPDNVLLAGEFALVTDFGVAKALTASTAVNNPQLTGGGMAIGTPAYMSPEQVLADPGIDHRADIYAFGIVAYEILTGAAPFRARTAQAILAAQAVQAPEPVLEKRADIPPALAEIVMRCLEKKPDDRPQTAEELLHLFDSMTSGSTPTGALHLPRPAAAKSRRWPAAGAIGALAVAGLAWFSATRFNGSESSSTANLSSVAVLPLVNVGGNQSDEYFSDGLTDELANALGKLPGLRVASRTSAYAFKGKPTDVGEIGRRLKVQAVLEGSVRRSGSKFRVQANLTSVSDGLNLWSEVYEREAKDVFTVQDELARAIAGALEPRLGTRARGLASEARGTNNLEAFDFYLRGRYFWNRRGADNLRLAISYFDSALVRDPRFARAHAARAIAYALLPEYTDAAPDNVHSLARDAAERALAIDSTLAEAYTAVGLAGVHEWRFHEAEAAYRKAIQLDPRYPTAHQWYGEMLIHTGRVDSSLAQMRIAADLDPLAPIIPAAHSYALLQAGQIDASIAELRKGIELAPSLGLHHAMLGAALLRKGQMREAIRELEQGVRLDPELAVRQGYLAYGYAMSGNQAKAREIVAQLEAKKTTDNIPAVAFVMAYLGLNDRERAIAALEEAVDQRDVSLFVISSLVPDEVYDPIRNDPRFEAILRRMNLWEFAQASRRR